MKKLSASMIAAQALILGSGSRIPGARSVQVTPPSVDVTASSCTRKPEMKSCGKDNLLR